jgi:hypothetical protein
MVRMGDILASCARWLLVDRAVQRRHADARSYRLEWLAHRRGVQGRGLYQAEGVKPWA